MGSSVKLALPRTCGSRLSLEGPVGPRYRVVTAPAGGQLEKSAL